MHSIDAYDKSNRVACVCVTTTTNFQFENKNVFAFVSVLFRFHFVGVPNKGRMNNDGGFLKMSTIIFS